MSTVKYCDRCGVKEICDYNSNLNVIKYHLVYGVNKDIVYAFDLCKDCIANLKEWINGKSSS